MPDIVWTGRQLNVADGQHRVQQLVFHGHNHAPVILFEGVNHQQEADLYYIKNKQKKRTDGWNAFNAGVGANRVRERALWAAINAESFSTPLTVKADEAELTSVAVLEEAYRTRRNSTVGGMPLVRKFLRVLRGGWNINRRQGLQQEARNIQTQRGLLQFIRANWHLSEGVIIGILRAYNAQQVNTWAAQQAGKRGVSRAEANYVRKVLNGLFTNSGYVSRAA